jgi:hypothetical protein
MFVTVVNTAYGDYAIVIIFIEEKEKMKTRVWEGKEGRYLLPFDYAINGDGEIFLVKAGREGDGYFAGYYDDFDLVVEEGTDFADKKNKEIFTGDLVKARSKRTKLYHIYEIKRIKGEFKFASPVFYTYMK